MSTDRTESKDPLKSSFNDLLGLRISQWSEGRAVVEIDLDNRHLNRSGVLHGGVLTTLIDAACGFAGCYCALPGRVRKALTLSLTTSFTGQARSGTIRAVASKRAGGRKIFVATAEVTNDSGDIIGLGEGTYRYRSGSEDESGVPE